MLLQRIPTRITCVFFSKFCWIDHDKLPKTKWEFIQSFKYSQKSTRNKDVKKRAARWCFFVTPPILENDFKFHYYLSKSLKPPARLLTISTPWPVMVGPSDQRWKQLFVMNLSNPGSAKKKTQMPNFGSKFFFNFGSKVLMENGHVTCTVVFF